MRRTLITVKLYRVHCGGDGSATVAPPFLLRLFVAERFALGEPEHIISFLSPVPVGSKLELKVRRTCLMVNCYLLCHLTHCFQDAQSNRTHLCVKRVVCKTGIHTYVFLSYSTEWYGGRLEEKLFHHMTSVFFEGNTFTQKSSVAPLTGFVHQGLLLFC